MGQPGRAAGVIFAIAIAFGCGGETVADGGPLDGALAHVPQLDAAPPSPDASLPFLLVRVAPGRGPFTGGRAATLRGSGFERAYFTDDCTTCGTITFGGTPVDDARFVDAHRIEVVVPAGAPGPADVVVTQGAQSSSLNGGYVYDPLVVTPPIGSVAGGTLVAVELDGGSFGEGDAVLFDGVACTDLRVEPPARVLCRTPVGREGLVEVRVEHAGGASTIAPDAFRYIVPLVEDGGLGGGPIEGAVDITVIDAVTGMPLADAFVLIGEDLASDLQGRTDAAGRVTLSSASLAGPLNVHIAKRCFETTSFVGVDARHVTAYLMPHGNPTCLAMPPGGRAGRNGSFVGGELVWPLGGPWTNVPGPRSGEVRVAYVLTTRARVGLPNPDPSTGGSGRVVEGDASSAYTIYSRSGGLAVYALAGTEDTSTGHFTPYVMGIARGLVLTPGETRMGVDITMDIPLDRVLDVELSELPALGPTGPDTFEVSASPVIGEGVLFDERFDVQRSRIETSFRFAPEPALDGILSDARYTIRAQWQTGELAGSPVTSRILRGVRPGARVTIDDFLAPPRAVAPAMGEELPADRVLRWSLGATSADLVVGLIIGGTGDPAWRFFAHGDALAAPIPDLGGVSGVDDIAPGTIRWAIFATRIPGFELGSLAYRHLDFELASHVAYDYFTAQRAP